LEIKKLSLTKLEKHTSCYRYSVAHNEVIQNLLLPHPQNPILKMRADFPHFNNTLHHLDNELTHLDNKLNRLEEKLYHSDNKLYHSDNKLYRLDEKLYHSDNKPYHLDKKLGHLDAKLKDVKIFPVVLTRGLHYLGTAYSATPATFSYLCLLKSHHPCNTI
jgi:hypothetical protein